MKVFLYGKAKRIAKNIDRNKDLKAKKTVELSQGEIIPVNLWPFNI